MYIQNLLRNVLVTGVDNYGNVEVDGISADFRNDCTGKAFVCLCGNNTDTHEHIEEIENAGAACIVAERGVKSVLPVFYVKNTRSALAVMCGNYHNNPAKKMNIITVIGTNGKTSTTQILSAIFAEAGFSTATVGTLGYSVNNEFTAGELTTPDPMELHAKLAEMQAKGVQYVFMEASAHAIYYDKLAGIHAKASILTNITQDHLDFFGNMGKYAEVKLSYFSPHNTSLAVLNVDDEYCRKLLGKCKVPIITYGLTNPSDVFALDIKDDVGLSFTVNAFDCLLYVQTKLHGKFNVYNVMAAISTAMYFGIGVKTIEEALLKMNAVNGRYEVRYVNGKKTVLDFAHTPDGLQNLLSDVRENTSGKVYTVFGCGGNRDKTKRHLMGSIAEQFSDYVIITDDNPRYEDEMEIAADIASGIDGNGYEIIVDRGAAIKKALSLAGADDCVVIAGKGHERYMEKMGHKTAYSDFDILQELTIKDSDI